MTSRSSGTHWTPNEAKEQNREQARKTYISRTLHLFGAGTLLVFAAQIAKNDGWDVCVRTSHRLAGFYNSDEATKELLSGHIHVADSLSQVMGMGARVNDGDVAFSFGAPWIFRSEWIELWRGRAYNVHSRRLPEHRGAGDVSWLIMMNERRGRACVHRLTTGIDDGNVVARRDFTYESPFTVASYRSQDLVNTKALLATELRSILERDPEGWSQDNEYSSSWPRLNSDLHGWINWTWKASEIDRFVRAFCPPLPGCSTFLRGERVRVLSSFLGPDLDFHPFQFGMIFRIDGAGLHLGARGGSLVVGIDRSAGLSPRVGDRFFTPNLMLERALGTRGYLKPDGTWELESSAPIEHSQQSSW